MKRLTEMKKPVEDDEDMQDALYESLRLEREKNELQKAIEYSLLGSSAFREQQLNEFYEKEIKTPDSDIKKEKVKSTAELEEEERKKCLLLWEIMKLERYTAISKENEAYNSELVRSIPLLNDVILVVILKYVSLDALHSLCRTSKCFIPLIRQTVTMYPMKSALISDIHNVLYMNPASWRGSLGNLIKDQIDTLRFRIPSKAEGGGFEYMACYRHPMDLKIKHIIISCQSIKQIHAFLKAFKVSDSSIDFIIYYDVVDATMIKEISDSQFARSWIEIYDDKVPAIANSQKFIIDCKARLFNELTNFSNV